MAGGNKGDGWQAKLKGDIISLPVYTGVRIYRGTMVMVGTADGYARVGADTASMMFVGIAEEEIDNTSGSSGDLQVRVRRRGIFKMTLATTAAKPSLIGTLVFIDTAQSSTVNELVDVVGNVTNKVLVGEVVKHGADSTAYGSNSTEVWVDITAATMKNQDVTTHAALTMQGVHFAAPETVSDQNPSITSAQFLKGTVLWSYDGASNATTGALPASTTTGAICRVVKTGTFGPLMISATTLTGPQTASNVFYGLSRPGDSVVFRCVGANSYQVIAVNQRNVVVSVSSTAEADSSIAAAVYEDALVLATHASVAIVVTLPAAAAGNAGARVRVAQAGAAEVTVVCAAGYGGGGTGKDTVTLAQGMMAIFESDGTNWYTCNLTVAA